MILLGIFAVFLALGQGPIYSVNGSIDAPEKNFHTDFSKVNTKFLLSAHYHSFLLMEKKSLSLKPT